MDTTHKRQQAARVTLELSLLQEDALVGIMYEEFGKNKMRHLGAAKTRIARNVARTLDVLGTLLRSRDSLPSDAHSAWHAPIVCRRL